MKKVKKATYTVLVIFLASVFLGCVGTKETKITSLEPKAEGKALYDYITKGNDYKNWNKWPGKGELYPRSPGSPHGDLLTTYVSDRAFSAVQGKEGSLPDESIVVKENYDGNKKLDALTVMYKEKGYDTEHNDWFWAKYGTDGSVQAEGKVEMCNDCHGQKKDNDYVFSSPLK